MARNASLTLRSIVRSFERKRFLANCWVIEEPPCTTPPAGDVEPVHEHGKTLVELAPPGPCLIEAGINARVEVEQDAAHPLFPVVWVSVVGEEVVQGLVSRKSARGGRNRPPC